MGFVSIHVRFPNGPGKARLDCFNPTFLQLDPNFHYHTLDVTSIPRLIVTKLLKPSCLNCLWIKFINGDCIAGMRSLPAECVDLAFADPPFNIGYEYDQYDDQREAEEYLRWSYDWLAEIKRVLKPDGTFWLAIGDEFAAELKVLMQRQLGLSCRSWVVWYYTFGVNCKYKFSRSHVHLFYMVKDTERFTFNADDPAVRVPSARQLVYGDKRANPKGRLPDDTWILRPQDCPESFQPHEDTWYVPRVNGTFKERKGWHGCQMPEQVLGRIIRACSHEGELVLDPFAGSGTTLAVAKKLHRRFLGFELSSDYAEQTTRRLSEIRPGQPLDGAENPLTSAPQTKEGVTLEDRQRTKAKAKTRRRFASAQFMGTVSLRGSGCCILHLDSSGRCSILPHFHQNPRKNSPADDFSQVLPLNKLRLMLISDGFGILLANDSGARSDDQSWPALVINSCIKAFRNVCGFGTLFLMCSLVDSRPKVLHFA